MRFLFILLLITPSFVFAKIDSSLKNITCKSRHSEIAKESFTKATKLIEAGAGQSEFAKLLARTYLEQAKRAQSLECSRLVSVLSEASIKATSLASDFSNFKLPSVLWAKKQHEKEVEGHVEELIDAHERMRNLLGKDVIKARPELAVNIITSWDGWNNDVETMGGTSYGVYFSDAFYAYLADLEDANLPAPQKPLSTDDTKYELDEDTYWARPYFSQYQDYNVDGDTVEYPEDFFLNLLKRILSERDPKLWSYGFKGGSYVTPVESLRQVYLKMVSLSEDPLGKFTLPVLKYTEYPTNSELSAVKSQLNLYLTCYRNKSLSCGSDLVRLVEHLAPAVNAFVCWVGFHELGYPDAFSYACKTEVYKQLEKLKAE